MDMFATMARWSRSYSLLATYEDFVRIQDAGVEAGRAH